MSFSEGDDNALTSGLELFMTNNPKSAVSWFELALKENPGDGKIYNYLGISYEQLGENVKAIETYQRGLKYAGSLESSFLTNIANNYVLQKKFDTAINFYTQAIELDNNGNALRNRAGEYLRKKSYDDALDDYKLYLTIDPEPYQETEIRRVISLLELKIDEFTRLQLEEERKRLEDDARQKELLSQVLNSLSTAGEDTTNLSAGSETVENYEADFDIIE